MRDAALLRLGAGQVKMRNGECGTPQGKRGGPPGGGRGPGGPIGSARGKGGLRTPTVREAVMVRAANARWSRPVKKRFKAFFREFLSGFRGQRRVWSSARRLSPPRWAKITHPQAWARASPSRDGFRIVRSSALSLRSSPRKRGPRAKKCRACVWPWIPAFAGMNGLNPAPSKRNAVSLAGQQEFG